MLHIIPFSIMIVTFIRSYNKFYIRVSQYHFFSVFSPCILYSDNIFFLKFDSARIIAIARLLHLTPRQTIDNFPSFDPPTKTSCYEKIGISVNIELLNRIAWNLGWKQCWNLSESCSKLDTNHQMCHLKTTGIVKT